MSSAKQQDNRMSKTRDLFKKLGEKLECEVKWALESISVNKASGGD